MTSAGYSGLREAKKVVIQGCLGPGSGRMSRKVKKVVVFCPARVNNQKDRIGPGLSCTLRIRLIIGGFGLGLSRTERNRYARAKSLRN